MKQTRACGPMWSALTALQGFHDDTSGRPSPSTQSRVPAVGTMPSVSPEYMRMRSLAAMSARCTGSMDVRRSSYEYSIASVHVAHAAEPGSTWRADRTSSRFKYVVTSSSMQGSTARACVSRE